MAPKADHGEDTYRGASLGEVGGPVIHIRFMLVVLWGRLEATASFVTSSFGSNGSSG
jgi:hypothetical protein